MADADHRAHVVGFGGRDIDGAVALGMSVLEAVLEGSLRANTRQRMLRLVTEVGEGGAAHGLAEAVRSRRV